MLIADDHTLFRTGLRALLNLFPDIQVIGEAASGEEAITLAEALQPDIILMDIQMPGVNGIEATRRIIHASPNTGIIVVTMFEDDDSVFAAMRARLYFKRGWRGGSPAGDPRGRKRRSDLWRSDRQAPDAFLL